MGKHKKWIHYNTPAFERMEHIREFYGDMLTQVNTYAAAVSVKELRALYVAWVNAVHPDLHPMGPATFTDTLDGDFGWKKVRGTHSTGERRWGGIGVKQIEVTCPNCEAHFDVRAAMLRTDGQSDASGKEDGQS